MKPQPPDGYQTIGDFMRANGYTRGQVDSWIRLGRLPYLKIGEYRLVKADAHPSAKGGHRWQ